MKSDKFLYLVCLGVAVFGVYLARAPSESDKGIARGMAKQRLFTDVGR